MAIKTYSPCPGGTGKKIKFCCNDLLPELEKISRMLSGEQYQACLQHIDRLLENERNRNRECLLALRCQMLDATGQYEAYKTAAADFLARHPDNQLALAENAIQLCQEDALAALEVVHRALRASSIAGMMMPRTYDAVGMTAQALLATGHPLASGALLNMMCYIDKEDEDARDLLKHLRQSPAIPLLLRDDHPLPDCPEGVPWKTRFDAALNNVGLGNVPAAAEEIAAMTADLPDEPVLWKTLAVLRGRLAESAACIEALRRYAALRARQDGGLDDAVEAEALAMFLTDDPLGDRLDLLNLVWTVRDADRAHESLLSSKLFVSVNFDPARLSNGQEPPPKSIFTVLDRPAPDSAAELAQETIPRIVGMAMFFGRQTDRDARLEVYRITADDEQFVVDAVNQAIGHATDSQPEKKVTDGISATIKLLRPSCFFPYEATGDQRRTVVDDSIRTAVYERWPMLKLGVFDGRTPQEAAADETCRVRLLAAIMVLEQWCGGTGKLDFNQLRMKLGLPMMEPIELDGQAVVDLPAARLVRLNAEKLSDDDLITALLRAQAFSIRPAIVKFATAVVERPSPNDSHAEKQLAYSLLARYADNIEQSLGYIAAGRRQADEGKQSHANWDLMELSLLLAGHNGDKAVRMLQHIEQKHIEEPGVGNSLTQLLIETGLINPDGTPAYHPPQSEPAMAAAVAEEPGELWTPEKAQAAESGGKLWTPE